VNLVPVLNIGGLLKKASFNIGPRQPILRVVREKEEFLGVRSSLEHLK
jgi:hypothetical protein